MIDLSPEERDAFAEVVNIGIGDAASALSELVREPVRLSVPQVEVLRVDGACDRLDETVGGRCCAVRESFSIPFSGEMFLVFSAQHSLDLVRRLVSEPVAGYELSELEQDTLIEIGNLIMNRFLSRTADLLDISISGTTLPEIVEGSSEQILDLQDDLLSLNGAIYFMEVEFQLCASNISGLLLMTFGVTSAAEFRERIRVCLLQQAA